MRSTADQTPLYKDCVTDINNGYRDLLRYYSRGDCRVGYLRAFELCLSQACPGKQLWKFDEYADVADVFPLGKDARAEVNQEVFRNYLMAYENIMRNIGLLDKDPQESTTGGIATFIMEDD